MPVDVFSARFEACLGGFVRLHVPKSRRRKVGRKCVVLARFSPGASVDGSETMHVPRLDIMYVPHWEGPKMNRNVPQEQRMRQKDQQATGKRPKLNPK